MKRLISWVVIAMLMVNVLALSFNVKPGASSPATLIVPDNYATIQAAVNAASPGDTVYVRAGIYPENVVVGKALSLVGENPQSTIIDGGGVGSVVNITADYVNVTGFTLQNSSGVWPNAGISLDRANYCSITGNNITNNCHGISLSSSSSNTLSGNNITANRWAGIFLNGVSGNSITGNTFTSNGLKVWGSYQNSVEDNTVNGKPLVYLEGMSNYTVADAGQVVLVNCENIRVEGLNLSSTTIGIELLETGNSTISGNNITNNWEGIYVDASSGNSITGNNITANNYAGIWFNSSSNNNSVSGNNITANNWHGFLLSSSSDNSISGNYITANNYDGIRLSYSSNYNSVSGNYITNNWYGIELDSSSNNRFYHNNLIYNAQQVYFFDSGYANVWDDGYPSGGNYWSDYNGTDACCGVYQNVTGSDGIGDVPYTIDANNIDHYPLKSSISNFVVSLAGTGPVNVAFMSNSTVGNVKVDESARSLSFNVSGPTGTSGFCRITLPNIVVESLWGGNYNVLLNGEPCPFTTSSDSENTYIYISYTHSEHQIVIIPEYPLSLTILVLATATTISFRILRRRKLPERSKENAFRKSSFFP